MTSVFDAYAAYYDLLYRDKDYAAEAQYVVDHIRRYAPNATRILELGCGTGGHAECLAQMGFSVHGIDMSPTMLDRAEQRKAGLPSDLAARMTFALGDIRTVRTSETYDAVIALFHVMSYQTSNADLRAAVVTVAAHLIPGGVFIFDCWYGPGVLTDPPTTRIRRLRGDGFNIIRLAEAEQFPNENRVDIHYEVIVEGTAGIKRIYEVHSMRYLFMPEVDLLLEINGMRRLSGEIWMTGNSPELNTWNVCFVAKL